MIRIEKHYTCDAVTEHEAELQCCQLDKNSLSEPNPAYPNYTGGQLYGLVRDMITFDRLKAQLFEDQGGICCYCGAKLEYPFNPQFRVEHVKPKESHRELAGEYENLLLSCRSTDEEKAEIAKVTKKQRKDFLHCDEAKDSSEIVYSPLTDECETKFFYEIDGRIKGADEIANHDIKTLGLDCSYLNRRRAEAISSIYDENGELLSVEELNLYKEAVMRRDKNNRHSEFCFVIKKAIESLTKN